MEINKGHKMIKIVISIVLIVVFLLALWIMLPIRYNIDDDAFVGQLWRDLARSGFDSNYITVESYTREQENKRTNRIDRMTAIIKYEDAFLTVWFEMEGTYRYSRTEFSWSNCEIEMKRIVDSDTSRFIGTYANKESSRVFLKITGVDQVCKTDDVLITNFGFGALVVGDYVMEIHYESSGYISDEYLFYQNSSYSDSILPSVRVDGGHYLLILGSSWIRMYPDGTIYVNVKRTWNAYEFDAIKLD